MAKTILVRSYTNNLFYIRFVFDTDGRLESVENHWDIKIPSFVGIAKVWAVEDWLKMLIKERKEFYIENE